MLSDFTEKSKLHVTKSLVVMRGMFACFTVWMVVCWSMFGLATEIDQSHGEEAWVKAWKIMQQNRSPSTKSILPVYNWWISDPEMSELSMEVVTPHTPWARHYAGPELKLVVIAPRWTQRATVELQQRFDFVATPVMTMFTGVWGDKNTPGYAWLQHGTEAITTAKALAALRGEQIPDIIIIGALSCSVIPETVEQAILGAMDRGAGLVLFNAKDITPRIKARIDRCRRSTEGDVYAVMDGIPLRGLPLPGEKDPRTLIGGGATFYERDIGGRIVVVDYSAFSVQNSCTLINCYISPPWSDEDERVRDIHYDYYCSFAGRCILWAARALPEIRLVGWRNLPVEVEIQDAPKPYNTLSVEPASLCPQGSIAEFIIRDEDGTVEHRENLSVTIDGYITLSMPQLKAGGHFGDIILRNPERRVLDWGSFYFTSRSGADIISIHTEKKSYKLDEPVALEIELKGNLEGARMEVDIRDTLGRVVWTTSAAVQNQVHLQAKVDGALTIQCDIYATLSRGTTVLAKRSQRVLVRQPAPPTDTFIYCAWSGIYRNFIRRRVGEIMAAQGIQSGIIFGNMDEWARLNVCPVPYMTRYYPENPVDSRVRQPCMTDPAYLHAEDVKLKEETEHFKHYSPLAYSLGDDHYMLATKNDACISPTCLNTFRKYLADQYSKVEALNTSWGTKYTSFDEAVPLTLEESIASRNFPAWADHRLYMDNLFVTMHKRAKSVIQSVDPGARVGFEGPLFDDSWQGYSWKPLMDTLDLMVPYPNAWRFDLVRSFGRPGLVSGGWYGGYAMYRNSDDGRSYPWFLLFNGCNSYWFFSDYATAAGGHPSEGLAPDLRVLPCLSTATREVHRIQEGIDRLVLGANRQTDAIAVYFSRPSVHASTVVPLIPMPDIDRTTQYLSMPEQKWALNTEANLRLLDDLGLSCVFVNSDDIAAGALHKGSFRLLVLPFVQAMSADEIQAVRKFVENGGAVIADVRPGLFNEHVKLLTKGQMDDMFGVVRHGDALDALKEEFVCWSSGGTPIKGENTMPVDSTVRTNGGVPAFVTSSNIPLFISHHYGKGQSLLMNVSIQHYLLTLRPAGQGEGIINFLHHWLSDVGIVPDVRVESVGEGKAHVSVRVFRYESGGTKLVGLLRSHKRVLDDPDAFVDRSPQPVIVHLGKRGYIYEIINRQSYGEGDHVQLQMPVATPFLFAVLPYRVMDVKVLASQKGSTIEIAADIRTLKGKAGHHVMRTQVVDACGKRRPEYANSFVASNGHGSQSFALAMNDPQGRWDIYVEDVITGEIGRQSVEIR